MKVQSAIHICCERLKSHNMKMALIKLVCMTSSDTLKTFVVFVFGTVALGYHANVLLVHMLAINFMGMVVMSFF